MDFKSAGWRIKALHSAFLVKTLYYKKDDILTLNEYIYTRLKVVFGSVKLFNSCRGRSRASPTISKPLYYEYRN